MGIYQLQEELKVDLAIAIQDCTAGVTGAVYYSMAEYRKAWILVVADSGAGETLTVTPRNATSAAGAGAANFTDTFTVIVTNQISYGEIDAADMPDGSEFLGVNLNSAGDTVNACAIIIRAKSRYLPVDNSDDVDANQIIDE